MVVSIGVGASLGVSFEPLECRVDLGDHDEVLASGVEGWGSTEVKDSRASDRPAAGEKSSSSSSRDA